jgi:hypothetical protein
MQDSGRDLQFRRAVLNEDELAWHLKLSSFVAKYGESPGAGSGFKVKGYMARPERFELPTFWFVARRSIQLS